MKKFNMKDLEKAKTIIGQKITQEFTVEILKIDQKKYIQNFLKSKKITLYYSTVFLVKAKSFFFLDQVEDHRQADLAAY